MTSTGGIISRVPARQHAMGAIRRAALSAGAAVIVIATAAGAQDFSFETPNANYYTYNPTGYAGATFSDKSGVAIQDSPFFSATSPDGTQAAFIQSTFGGIGAFSLALSGLTQGSAYTTSFYATQRPGYAVTPLIVSFAGTVLGTYAAPSSTVFTKFTVPDFVATETSGTLTFSGSSSITGDDDVIVDAVSVSRSLSGTSSPGAVPEIGTWAMMIAGFGMLGFILRRRSGVVHSAAMA